MRELSNDWQPTASIATLMQRAELLAGIRQFFAARHVIEVDTQILSHAAITDPFIDCISADFCAIPNQPEKTLYLQTSPEYAMKRLLAAGMGPIYQLGKVFRNGEVGRRHNPEFTLLEWYQPGWDLPQLMDEVEALVASFIAHYQWSRLSYHEVFLRYTGLDITEASVVELQHYLKDHISVALNDDNPDTWLNLIMSHLIEPQLQGAVFVYDFPPSQAALAQLKTNAQGVAVASRFELYLDGLELANGYHELTNAQEQQARLEQDQQQRRQLNLPTRPIDQRLVAALAAGMPDSSGVALGVDRLLMRLVHADSIQEVIPFPFERA